MPNYDGSDYSPDTYKVTSGKHHHRREDGTWERLRAGDTFHPTLKQVRENSLENKAVRVKEGGPRPSVTVGVDFDAEGNIVREEPTPLPPPARSLDDLAWGSEAARANAAGLSVEELEAVGPTGATGYVTADVRRALEAREA